MSLFITSDFHINEAKRFKDTKLVLYNIIKQVKSCAPDNLVVTGDIFDKRKPTPLEMQCFNKWLLSIREHVLDTVILLEGNHDQDRDVSTLSYLSDLNIHKVKVVSPPYIFKDELGLRFYFGHETISGVKSDSGFELDQGVSVSNLIEDNPDVDVFAFGHFHTSQVLHQSPLVFYVGSINSLTFAERNDTKVTWFFDKKNKLHKLSLPTRKMFQFELSVREDKQTPVPWHDLDLSESMVKLIITGTKEELKTIKADKLKQDFTSEHVHSLKIQYNVISRSTTRNSAITESVKEEVALKEYFKDKDIDPVLREKIIQTGVDLIKELNK